MGGGGGGGVVMHLLGPSGGGASTAVIMGVGVMRHATQIMTTHPALNSFSIYSLWKYDFIF